MNHKIWIMVFAVFLSGCATQGVSTREYRGCSQQKINNELNVPRPQSEVWDTIVKELSKSFYVINNIDKESRIINVSFSSNAPSGYVDCGKSHRTYTQRDKTETYDYDTAGSSYFKVATLRQEHPAFANYVVIRRETSLEGRSNIYVAPSEQDKNSTVITVNTRYIMNFKIKSDTFAQHANGKVFSRGHLPDETFTVMFNTNQLGELKANNAETISCCSKGTLEAEILGMTRGERK